MEENKAQENDSIKIITERWNNMSSVYQYFDSSMQSFFYTLINMLQLDKSKHILEVACGTGKLLPFAMSLKSKETTYLATDISANMIELAKVNLKEYIQKMGSASSTENWMQNQKLTLRVANGQEKIDSPYKFDRIIANLVLMITEDPLKMLKNFHSMAAEGCLLGVTIWGDKKQSNFLTVMRQALQVNNLPPLKSRSNFHLFNKLEQLGSSSGWEIVLQWEQNSPFPYFQIQESLMELIRFWCKNNQVLIDFHVKRVKQIFSLHKTLNFPVQMAILKKKQL